MSKWTENKIQFPRLIAQLNMAGAFTEQVMADLQESMDLSEMEIKEIIERAALSFELIKNNSEANISLDPIPLCPDCLGTKTFKGQLCQKCTELPSLNDIKLPGDTNG